MHFQRETSAWAGPILTDLLSFIQLLKLFVSASKTLLILCSKNNQILFHLSHHQLALNYGGKRTLLCLLKHFTQSEPGHQMEASRLPISEKLDNALPNRYLMACQRQQISLAISTKRCVLLSYILYEQSQLTHDIL